MKTIDQESRQRIRLPIDLDNMGDRYKTTTGYYTFTSPDLWSLEKNLYFLLRYSTEKEFNPKYFMRPDYLSYDEYGTVQLAQLLMYVNSVPSIEDFDLKTVLIPSMQAVVEVTKHKFSTKEMQNMESVSW